MFGAPRPLVEINTAAGEGTMCCTRDGRELYYVRGSDIWVAWRSQERADAHEPFEHKQVVVGASSSYHECAPSISADGHTLFWSDLGDFWGGKQRPCPAAALGNVWYATRSERWTTNGQGRHVPAPFGPARCLGPPINGPVNDGYSGVSWGWPQSGAKFYFCRYGPGQYPFSRMWEATWHVDCNGDGIDDFDQIKRGEVADANGDGLPDMCEGSRFLRGDANADSILDPADAAFVLDYLFVHGTAPTCLDAADADDDGRIDLRDGIYLLQHLFAQGSAVPPPFSDCGRDPTADPLWCESFPPCE
jgi:hypothetical protein